MKPVRVLHVVRGMSNGGVETWLMRVLRRIDCERGQFDFLVHTEEGCFYDAEIEARGRRILRCCEPTHSPEYAFRIRQLLRANGPYDAVHSHVHHFSGYLLWLAHSAGVPVRIAHSHTDTALPDARCKWARQGYLRLMKRWIHRYATHMAAVSERAGECLFGTSWKRDSRSRILNCGVDLSSFPQGPEKQAARVRTRALWNIPPEAFVIGHIGRFDPPKNHEFLLNTAIEMMRRDSATMLLLVGDGPLRGSIRALSEKAGLGRRVIFAGTSHNVPDILEAMDVFLFPSLYEGLGLALVEAQASGLPCVTSEAVPEEAVVLPELVQRRNLHAGTASWVDALIRARNQERFCLRAWRAVQSSTLNVERSVEQLYGLYNA